MKRLQMAVVGAGSLGRHHVRKLAEADDVDLVGIADPDETTGRQLADEHGTTWFPCAEQLPPAIDGVVVAAPTVYHLQCAQLFLRKGIPTFVEKPLAGNVRDAEAIWRAAAQSDALLQVGHIERFNPAFEAAQARCESPLYIRAQRVAPYTFRSTDIGVIHDLMIHDLDLVLALTGELPESVEAFGAIAIGPHEDMAVARLTMPSGTVVDLTASRVSPSVERSLQIWDRSGCLQVDLQQRKVKHWCAAGAMQNNPALIHAVAAATADPRSLKDRVFGEWIQGVDVSVADGDAMSAELEEFKAAIRGECRPRVCGREGLNAMQVAEDVRSAVRLWSYQTGTSENTGQSRRAA